MQAGQEIALQPNSTTFLIHHLCNRINSCRLRISGLLAYEFLHNVLERYSKEVHAKIPFGVDGAPFGVGASGEFGFIFVVKLNLNKMLRNFFKWASIILSVLLAILLVVFVAAHFKLERQQKQVMEVAVQSLEIPKDSAAIAKGAHLAAIKGCAECHGDDGSGKVMIDDPTMGLITASNLTRGKGGLPESYTNTDWVRALKHGLGADGTPLLVMPSQETTLLSAEDMSAIIAYYNSLPPVDNQSPQISVGPLLKVLSLFEMVPLFPAHEIDHQRTLTASVEVTVGAAYGLMLNNTSHKSITD